MTAIGEINKSKNQSRVRMVSSTIEIDETVVDLDLRSFFTTEENRIRGDKVAAMMGRN